MERVIGYWSWDSERLAMAQPYGSRVRFLGVDPERPFPGNRQWLRFEVTVPEGRLELPVEQRLTGRDSNFRGLRYRVDFRGAAPAFPLWAAAERVIADALASWPRGELIDGHPVGVGIQGGFLGGAFRDDFYRLYLPSYVGTPTFSGGPVPHPRQRQWIWSPARAGETPDLSAAAKRGFDAFMTAAGRAAERFPSLTDGERTIVLLPDEHERLTLLYVEEAFASFRFSCGPHCRDQEERWSIFESAKGSDISVPEPPRTAMEWLDALFPPKRLASSAGKRPEPLPPFRRERAYSAFHEALFEIPEGATGTDKLRSPPVSVRSPAPWLRAGYVEQDCVTATQLLDSEFEAAFLDEPDASLVLDSPAGPAFDARAGALYAPDGSSLVLEDASEWLGVAPMRLRLRCRLGGLDWPILVQRLDHRPHEGWSYNAHLISRWAVDYGECLEVWHREGHSGLPERGAWDCLRQFVEEAILNWGDGPAAGPAPQSFATVGGWYEGQWRGAEFRRLLARPIQTGRIARTDEWRPYAPCAPWRRTDDTPAGLKDPSSYAYSPPRTPPVPFEKVAAGGAPARLFASAFIMRFSRDEGTRHDLVDYQDDHDHVRLGGTRGRVASAGLVRVGGPGTACDEQAEMKWPAREAVELPGLTLWRRLRDACEGGLREGEAVALYGGYFFDRLYADAVRVTSLAAEFEDFDYRMFGIGNAFAR